MNPRLLRIFVLVGLLLVAMAPMAGEQPALEYKVSFQGAGDLESLLTEVAESVQLREKAPPPGLVSLRRRARNDLTLLGKALRSRGYYASRVSFELDENAEPVELRFDVDLGPLYRFGRVRVVTQPEETRYQPPTAAGLGLQTGEPALAEKVLAAETTLLTHAREASFALAELGPRHLVVDHAARVMEVELQILPGEPVRLGAANFSGGEGVARRFLLARVPWQPGDVYHPKLLREAQRKLVDSSLFASVRVIAADALDVSGQLPVQFDLTEREHRTLKASLTYDTDLGPGVRGGWTHRNLFGAGQRLEFEGGWSAVGPELSAKYRQPDFFRLDQALIGQASLTTEDTDAYNSSSAYLSGGVERNLAPGMDLTPGVGFRYSNVESADGEEKNQYGFLSMPVRFDWDFSDDLLDPTSGGRVNLLVSPQMDLLGSGTKFGKFLVRYSHYLRLREQPRLVLAGRIALGSIIGAKRNNVPPDERFYAGGGGSLRGYAYQLVSPLDDEDNPIGGNSLLETSLEARWKFTDTIGMVGFLDAGNVFKGAYPDLGGKLFYGAGAGVRYYSPIGPLRLDVALPLSRRKGVDDAYQVYVSIGQAF